MNLARVNIIEILEYILLICFAKESDLYNNSWKKRLRMLENVRSFCVVVYVVTDLNSADVDFRLFSFYFFVQLPIILIIIFFYP